ncbi:MAG: hypothetical protein U0270_07730 [Labilithrix sp.]
MIRRFFVVMPIVLGAIGCKEPMADDPGYRATVLCNNTMKGQGGGTNAAKARCIGWVGDRYKADPKGDYDAYAKCIMAAGDDEKLAKACQTPATAPAASH